MNTVTLDLVTAVDDVVDNHLVELWEQLFLDCLTQLALPADQRQHVIGHRMQVKNWTTPQLSQFLRDTESRVWTSNAQELAVQGKFWVATFIAAQVELGQRLASWPPVLEILEMAHEDLTKS